MDTQRPSRGWAVYHGGFFLLIVGAVAVGLPAMAWPLYLLVPLGLYAASLAVWPAWRRSAPRLALGRVTGAPLGAAMALGVATSAALVWFHWLVRPEMAQLAAKLPMIFLRNLVVAALCFSALNALLEELVFRGVLYEALAAEWGAAVAVGGTAAAFGLGHLAGYPPGITGAILAGLYGIALGLLRWWAGGLGLVLACHMAADATIFSLMAWEGAFRGTEG